MGIRDWFRRNGSAPAAPPRRDLRSELIALAATVDREALLARCRSDREQIAREFPSWTKVPEEVRSRPDEVRRYADALIAVAELFEKELGDASLIARLGGPNEDNPIVRWEKALEQARDEIEARRWDDAERILERALGDTSGLAGSGVDVLRPITLGLLGQCRFHVGRVEEAARLFSEALDGCRAAGDAEGEIAYLGSLYESQRWLGKPAEAARFAELRAEVHERVGEAARAVYWRRRASMVRNGEPRVRVVVEIAGDSIELDDLPRGALPPGLIRFLFERDRMPIGKAGVLVERGRDLGGEGQHEQALECFAEAARVDPWDPEPEYLRAQALLHLRRYAEALEAYARTEQLAPGWYHCRADAWLAGELAAGRLPHDAFEAIICLEDRRIPPDTRLRVAESAVARWPSLAPLRLLEAKALIDMGQREEAAEVVREALKAASGGEPDIETRMMVELSQLVSEKERRELLRSAIARDGNRIAAAMARVMLAALS